MGASEIRLFEDVGYFVSIEKRAVTNEYQHEKNCISISQSKEHKSATPG